MKWTPEEDEVLVSLYLSHERKQIAAVLGRTPASIRKRCSVLGLNQKHPAVSDKEMEEVRQWYEFRQDANLEDFSLDSLAQKLNRTKQFISRLAGRMGLTKQGRPIGDKVKNAIGESSKKRIATKGHPKGMLGKKHTDQFKAEQSKRVKAREFTPEQVEARIEKQMRTKIERYGAGRARWLSSPNAYSRAKSGSRADLNNCYFRSAWEANYARYLNWLAERGEIQGWEYECKTFLFAGVTRGAISYTPDFKVTYRDGSYEWHEIKGWITSEARTRLKRMTQYYPDEKVVVITKKEYTAIAKWKGVIPNWE
jgi:phage gpG-like protein